jgi:O-antigen/teichoic acid export membrane protein
LNVDERWAAAAVPPTAALWLILCVQRGTLLAMSAYRAVGISIVVENALRLVLSLVLVIPWRGVTAAYVGTLAGVGLMAVLLAHLLGDRLGPPVPLASVYPLRRLLRRAALPVVALTLLAALQNVDTIIAKHVLDEHTAGVYAAAAVAGKAMVYVAIGLGLWVLPEAARRAASGIDPRIALVRALLMIAALSVVALTIFGAAPRLVMRLAFGAEYESGDEILFTLGAAYALLAVSYVATQYLLGLHRRRFLVLLTFAAAALPVWLLQASTGSGFARSLLTVQGATAAGLLLICLRTRSDAEPRRQ